MVNVYFPSDPWRSVWTAQQPLRVGMIHTDSTSDRGGVGAVVDVHVYSVHISHSKTSDTHSTT